MTVVHWVPFDAALHTAIVELAGFVGADPQDVVPVVNATTAVNVVLNSLSLGLGDLILLTTLTYPAVCSNIPGFPVGGIVHTIQSKSTAAHSVSTSCPCKELQRH